MHGSLHQENGYVSDCVYFINETAYLQLWFAGLSRRQNTQSVNLRSGSLCRMPLVWVDTQPALLQCARQRADATPTAHPMCGDALVLVCRVPQRGQDFAAVLRVLPEPGMPIKL